MDQDARIPEHVRPKCPFCGEELVLIVFEAVDLSVWSCDCNNKGKIVADILWAREWDDAGIIVDKEKEKR